VSRPLERIAIVGCGLMGCSLALAAKARFPGVHVTGVDAILPLTRAVRRGGLDRAVPVTGLAGAVAGADLVFLAAPVGTIVDVLPAVLAAARDAVVTDLGSAKEAICAAARRAAPEAPFVGGHPFCGGTGSGPAEARADLFEGASWVLTPADGAPPSFARPLERFIRTVGGRVRYLTPRLHDELAARLSHLPQVLATALAASTDPAHIGLAAGGFRDTTRLAASPYPLWRDILFANRSAVLDAVEGLQCRLSELARCIEAGDGKALSVLWERGRVVRKRLSPARPEPRPPVEPAPSCQFPVAGGPSCPSGNREPATDC